MGKSLYDYLARPDPFQRGAANFWDDEHVSRLLLEKYLESDIGDAGGYRDDVAHTVEWVAAAVPPARHPDLLELGCGPGLSAECFADKGFRVTGVDFSRRSIAYARERAAESERQIVYLFQNYLDMDFAGMFDVVVFGHGDYGALSPAEAAKVLASIHKGLRPGGKLVLDVCTMAKYEAFAEGGTWEYLGEGGFWNPGPHHCLHSARRYDRETTLEQVVVAAPDRTDVHYIWNRHFAKDGFVGELALAGFGNPILFDDMCGAPYTGVAETMAAIWER